MKNKGKFFDDEDRALIESYEKQEWKSLPKTQKEREMKRAKRAATNTLRKDARVNIRLSSLDLMHLKTKAAAEGIPYQTLLSGLIHKYVSGQIRAN